MTTDIQRWQRIRALVEGALELSDEERSRWLADACRGDAALRREVEGLLEHDSRVEDLDAPTPGRWVKALVDELDCELGGELGGEGDCELGGEGVLSAEVAQGARETGRRIGAYLLIGEVGTGGMGKVYLAQRDDAQYQKRVAIKLIKRGMDTDDILRRFKNERQILANLEHPNIARLLDGGATDDGLPYLVLEYVDGVPIDRFCDEHRSTIRERIELFLAVCSAVHYAHQSLVVHRDLKPSNILVTTEGVPKLLDFGIAKLLAPSEGELDPLHTLTSERRLTPAYASPEQLRGETITTASDIFSLGVVLYELLTGEKPFEGQARTAESALLEQPEKPSTIVASSRQRAAIGAARRVDVAALKRVLAGDLDTIVQKSMHADPSRRYLSVGELASDLRRHLDGMPVQARPDSFGYRASKFVKRNKLLVGAAATIFVALAVGFTTSTVLYFQAVRAQAALKQKSVLAENRLHDAQLAQAAEKVQRELAERRFADVRKLAATFIFDVHAAIEPLQGSLPARQLIVRTATEYLERLASEKRDDAELQHQLAQAWLRIGEIQSAHGMASFGQTNAALRSVQKTLAIADDLVRADPINPSYGLLSVQAHTRLVEMLMQLHRLPEARSTCEETVTFIEKFSVEHPGMRSLDRERLRAHNRLAEVLGRMGEDEASLEQYRVATRISEELAHDWLGDDVIQATMGNSLQLLGQILERNQKLDEALQVERRALAVFQRLVVRDPTHAVWRREIGVCRSFLARIYNHQGCFEEAGAEARAGLETMISLRHDDGANASGLSDTAGLFIQHASFQIGAGELDDAIRYCSAALGYLDDLVRRDPDDLDVRHELATANGFLGAALVGSGRCTEGLHAFLDARAELEALAAAQPSDANVQLDLYYCCVKLGRACASFANATAENPEERAANLGAACRWLQQGVEGLRWLKSRGQDTAIIGERMEGFEEDLRRCHARLGQMDGGAQEDPDPTSEREHD